MSRFALGEPAPWFTAPTPTNPRFHFSSIAGRYVLLGFMPAGGEAQTAALTALQARRALLDDNTVSAFVVLRDAHAIERARDGRGLRWFLDADGEVSRLWGALDETGGEKPMWVLLDPALRVLSIAPLDAADAMLARLATLPKVEDHAGVTLHAPVLIVPRVLEPDLCRRLIDLYEAEGGQPSGVMREVDGRTVGVLDDFKKRRDVFIRDPALQAALRTRLGRRLLPEIAKAFQFEATRIERYIVASYDAEEGGYFRPHRDNTTKGTAHRKFAVSINLNAEEFEGGDLRFPEFGPRTYRPPTGGAVVFSCTLLHEATPVTRGRRYAYLPFLYDEAGARIRAENLPFLQPDPPASGPAATEEAATAEAPA